MTDKEALKLALEALEDLQRQYSIYPNSFWDWSKGRKAITAIKQALAAPVQEWMKPHPKCDEGCLFQCTKGFTQFPECATTPPAQPAPVRPTKDVEISNMGKPFTVKAYVTPPAAPVQWPTPEDQPVDNGPDYEDGPDEEGFSGPRPWNSFSQPAPVQPVISAGPITPAMQAGPTPEQKEQMVRAMQSAYPAAQPALAPLTEKELRRIHHEDQFGLFCDFDEFEQIVRATEQAHGITKETYHDN